MPTTKNKKLTAKQLDAVIASYYSKIAEGKVINIMDIPKVYTVARNAYETSGGSLDRVADAVRASVALFCMESR